MLDFSAEALDGAQVEHVLDQIGISVSKSLIPHDSRPAFRPSGVRIGSSAMTSRGVKEEGFRQIVQLIHQALHYADQPQMLARLQQEVETFARSYPHPSLVLA